MTKADATITEWITQLRDVEIALGNIPKPNAWDSRLLEKFAQASLDGTRPISDSVADHLFLKISFALKKQGHSTSEIAAMINAVVFYKGGPSYCDASEVEDALGDAK